MTTMKPFLKIEALCKYISDTFSLISTVRGFCESSSKWLDERKTAVKNIQSKNNVDGVLKETLRGLEKLEDFLDAVEKLAVTSKHVFMNGRKRLQLPKDISHVQSVIMASQCVGPLLLVFKRDANMFFLPKEQNVEVLANQLDKYIQTTQKICQQFQESHISDLTMNKDTKVHVDVRFSEHDLLTMLDHINQLDEIRENEHFRMLFLFQEISYDDFMMEFKERQPRMLQSLNDLEECAVQLDRMNTGSKISSIAGSSVGAVGGALSIAGLALMPFTAGLSLGLTIGGKAMGITSGVNNAVTTFTGIGVNRKYETKAKEVLESLMTEMTSLQTCLEQVIFQPVNNIEGRHIESLCTGSSKVVSVGKSVHSLAKDVSDLRLIKNKDVIVRAGGCAGGSTRLASETPDVGQAALKGTLTTAKSMRVGLIALNSLFIGMDIFYICKESIDLAKGSKTEVSKFIRARAALWSSEIDSWKKIYDSLCLAQRESKKKKAVLDKPFYVKNKMCFLL
uniref:Apolipoprotein L n=1 Tax=Nothobranchius furzeri TaxID=105023 RepID=A0A8C6M8M1_NOTFU